MSQIKMYVIVHAKYSHEDDYDPEYPYKFSLTDFKPSPEFNTCVGEHWVEAPKAGAYSHEHIVLCKIRGLEETQEERRARHIREMTHIDEQIANLKALPALVHHVDDDVPF